MRHYFINCDAVISIPNYFKVEFEASRNKNVCFYPCSSIKTHPFRLRTNFNNVLHNILARIPGRLLLLYDSYLPLYSISCIASITRKSICWFACLSPLTDWELRLCCICLSIQHLAEIPEPCNMPRTSWLKKRGDYTLWVSCPLSFSPGFFFLFNCSEFYCKSFRATHCHIKKQLGSLKLLFFVALLQRFIKFS